MDEEQGTAAASGSSLKKKHEDKHRKKDPKSWENISKLVSTMNEEDRLSCIEEKYQQLYNDVRTLTVNNQQLIKQSAGLLKDRDHNQSELAKSVVARARLENLCRELQKQNKQIKEENMTKIKEEEERRKEVSSKFAEKLSDINNMMDENKEKSDKLREENLKMTAKLADLYNQFQRREEDISKMSHQLDLERQFSQATLAKMELEIRVEKEMHAKEQTIMKSNLGKSEANCAVLLETVKGLQDHIDVYKNQYEDFENTMSKSTKVFDNFKFEIANMTKQVNNLEHEAQMWKSKFHDSMKALVEVSETKRNHEVYIQSLEKKIDQLHKLCRQLQVDRGNYLKLLKSHGIEPITTLASPPKEEEMAGRRVIGTGLTVKEKELQMLKDNLKAVQNELTRLSVEDAQKAQEKKTDTETSQESAKNDAVQSEEKVLESISQDEAIVQEGAKNDAVQLKEKVLESISIQEEATLQTEDAVNTDQMQTYEEMEVTPEE